MTALVIVEVLSKYFRPDDVSPRWHVLYRDHFSNCLCCKGL